MPERKKLELEVNKPIHLELLFDEPVTGESRYGAYYLYAVKGDDGVEYSFFAPEEAHNTMKNYNKGDSFFITKQAEQKGSKIITNYAIQKNGTEPKPNKDNYYTTMLGSYEDAMKIQEKLNGLVDVNRIAITLFIARSKGEL